MKDDDTVPILTTSLIHCSLQGWENALFELGSERVNGFLNAIERVLVFSRSPFSSGRLYMLPILVYAEYSGVNCLNLNNELSLERLSAGTCLVFLQSFGGCTFVLQSQKRLLEDNAHGEKGVNSYGRRGRLGLEHGGLGRREGGNPPLSCPSPPSYSLPFHHLGAWNKLMVPIHLLLLLYWRLESSWSGRVPDFHTKVYCHEQNDIKCILDSLQ